MPPVVLQFVGFPGGENEIPLLLLFGVIALIYSSVYATYLASMGDWFLRGSRDRLGTGLLYHWLGVGVCLAYTHYKIL